MSFEYFLNKYNGPENGVAYRRDAQNWMKCMGINDAILDQIFYHENPTIETVLRLVNRHGASKAKSILESFYD